MKVKMLVSISGLACPIAGFERDFSFSPGDVVTVKPELAKAWIAAGHAETVKEEKPAKAEKK